MTLTLRPLLAILAIVLFVLGAILGFGMFGSSADLGSILGVISLGLAALAAAIAVP